MKLTSVPACYSDPVWSPDGSKIVALRAPRREKAESAFDFGAGAGDRPVWVPASGGEAHLIIPARGASRPHFGPEADRVYVTTTVGPGLDAVRRHRPADARAGHPQGRLSRAAGRGCPPT